MEIKNMIFFIITIVIIIGVSILFSGCSLSYPTPTGEFKVGTVLLELEDSNRNEWVISEQNRNRRFVVRIWYPAKPTGKELRLPIMEKPYSEGMSKLYGLPGGSEKPSQSYQNASVLQTEIPYPIIIFTHGAGSFATQNLTSMEELASQGFLVMSMSFPYESAATIFPDSTVIEMADLEEFKTNMENIVKDKEFNTKVAANIEALKNPNPQKAKEASIELGKVYSKLYPQIKTWLDTRIADLSYLINSVDEIHIDNIKLTDIADKNNIGLFGHSLGALTTLKFLMEKELPAIKCGISLDVPYFNLDSESSISINAPILFMNSDKLKIGDSEVRLSRTNDFLAHYTEMPLHECTVKGSAHYNFTDLNYVSPLLKFTPLLGSISQKEAAKILTHYLNAYFGYHLKNENIDKLNDSISSEVSFREILK